MTKKDILQIKNTVKTTKNLIKRRLILSYLKEIIANVTQKQLEEDLSQFNQFKSYLVTKEQVEERASERKEKGLPFVQEDYYEDTGNHREFYLYEAPPNGVTDVLYAKCFVIEKIRCGHNELVCLAGVYPVDRDGNVNGPLMGYRLLKDMNIIKATNEICSHGTRGLGKLYIGGADGTAYESFSKLKNYVQKQLKKRDNDIIINDFNKDSQNNQ